MESGCLASYALYACGHLSHEPHQIACRDQPAFRSRQLPGLLQRTREAHGVKRQEATRCARYPCRSARLELEKMWKRRVHLILDVKMMREKGAKPTK